MLVLLALGGEALDGEALGVKWSAPPSCPQVEAVQRAIAANLARDDFGDAWDAVTVEGAIAADPAGWKLDVSIRLPGG